MIQKLSNENLIYCCRKPRGMLDFCEEFQNTKLLHRHKQAPLFSTLYN